MVKVLTSAVPEYHLDSTENGRPANPYTAKCSRVLISTLSRSRIGGASSDRKR